MFGKGEGYAVFQADGYAEALSIALFARCTTKVYFQKLRKLPLKDSRRLFPVPTESQFQAL